MKMRESSNFYSVDAHMGIESLRGNGVLSGDCVAEKA